MTRDEVNRAMQAILASHDDALAEIRRLKQGHDALRELSHHLDTRAIDKALEADRMEQEGVS